MSEFFWGMLALPLLAVVAALAAGGIMWGWEQIDTWRERRFDKLTEVRLARPAVKLGDHQMWTKPDLGRRGLIAANIMTRPKAYLFTPLAGIGFIFVGGMPDVKRVLFFNRVLNDTVLEVQKREADD